MRIEFRPVLLAALLLALPVPGTARAGEARRLSELAASDGDFAVGLAAHRRGDLDAAVRSYGLAVSRDPAFVEALVNLARALADQGDLDRAERWLDRARGIRADYYAVPKVAGLIALRRGQLELAIQELDRARRLRPEDPEILTNLGASLLGQGRGADAVRHLTEAARIDPGSPAAALNLALARDLENDRGRAAYHYRRFLDLAPPGESRREAVRDRLRLLGGTPRPTLGAGPAPDRPVSAQAADPTAEKHPDRAGGEQHANAN